MTTKTEARDLSLSEIWDAMTAAGATVYEWCDGGVSTGCQAVRLGGRHVIAVSDSEGYTLDDAPDDDDLVPAAEYDDEQAERDASDLDGFFGVAGEVGFAHHVFEWFADEAEAAEWADTQAERIRGANPVLGPVESFAVPAADVFDVTYRDGNRVYFRPREAGQAGFVPK